MGEGEGLGGRHVIAVGVVCFYCITALLHSAVSFGFGRMMGCWDGGMEEWRNGGMDRLGFGGIRLDLLESSAVLSLTEIV